MHGIKLTGGLGGEADFFMATTRNPARSSWLMTAPISCLRTQSGLRMVSVLSIGVGFNFVLLKKKKFERRYTNPLDY